MGTFSVKIEISDLAGQTFEEMDALVDADAMMSVIPASTLWRLGIQPVKSAVFERASGEQVTLDMGHANVRVQDKETIAWVIFGEDADDVLLGSHTLTGVMLGVDPSAQRLIPVHGSLKSPLRPRALSSPR